MPQMDNSNFCSTILNLIKIIGICYVSLLYYFFYPLISNIKAYYHFFGKVQQMESLFKFYFF